MVAFALLFASAFALDSASTAESTAESTGTSKGLTVKGLTKGLSAVKPLHRGITTVKLTPTERRHLVSFVDKGEVIKSAKLSHEGHKGTATVSLMPTHKHEDVQLLQTVPSAKAAGAAFLKTDAHKKDVPSGLPDDKDASAGLPSQGYGGGSVMHEDGQTMTKDWMHEYDKPVPKPAPVSNVGITSLAVMLLFASW
jgi:hypothetical protein